MTGLSVASGSRSRSGWPRVIAGLIGPVSGAHVNPAVTVGLAVAGRLPWHDVPRYLLAQLAGAVSGGAILFTGALGVPRSDVAEGFGANGYGAVPDRRPHRRRGGVHGGVRARRARHHPGRLPGRSGP